MTDIRVDDDQFNAVLDMLNGIERDAVTALRRSLNKTATFARSQAAKGVAKTITMKQRDIKEFIVIKRRATNTDLGATIRLTGKLTPVIKFKTRQLRKGVSVKVFKQESAIKMRYAFYATMSNGHKGVFMRDPNDTYNHRKQNSRRESRSNIWGSTELSIVEQFGPSVTTIFENTPGLQNQVERDSADRLLTEIDAQVNFILSQYENN